ncbi:hypothetical protein Q4S45_18150 [Massilia sp. R2A-15]|uniref:hypothetical protein n=1 Tax=Massilia sp. R2A-15 TaxID=3064278 RepID=UPI002735CF42|nr:hypothetical protein [Massilia sp. R2A-15]WLI88624.1 hypothetical protein Q4S45_18150 [Massilia sp. R2A-15]
MCTSSETVYFSCQTAGAKSVGLCGAALGHLQYRFGKPGKLEFSFPPDGKDGARSMRLAHYFRYQVDRTEVTFSNQGNDYALYDYTEDGKRSAGVRVATAAGKEVDIACVKLVQSRLGELDGVLKCDADNALSMGACPTK